MRIGSGTLVSASVALVLAMQQARAANVEFQNFFFGVCGAAPSGALASRCAETPGGLGNLSGDSESSLNPSQNLSHNLPALAGALTRSNAARERAEHLRGGEEGDASGGDATAGPFGMLINAHYTDTERASDGAVEPERGLAGTARALEIGFDRRLAGGSVLGAILGFEQGDHEFDAENAGVNFVPAARAGEADVDNRYLTLFGSFPLGSSGFLEIAAGYESRDGEFERFSVFQESTRSTPQTNVTMRGDADGSTIWGSLNVGLDLARGAWSFGPYAGILSSRVELDGYTEADLSGSGLAMSFGDATRDSLLAQVGLRAGYAVSSAAGVFVPQLRVEYRSELEDERQTVAASYALDGSGTQFLLVGDEYDGDVIEAGFSFSAVLRNGWMPFLDYELLIGSDDLDRQRATVGLRVEF